MKQLYFLLWLVTIPVALQSQQFGVRVNTEDAFNGYMLVESFPSNFLIDNCGEIINEWENVSGTDNHVKLLPNGNILYIKNNTITEKNWNGQTVREWINTRQDLQLDYEIISMDSGNWLAIVRKSFSQQEFMDAGYNIGNIGIPTQVDGVIEVDPTSGEIVWEWYIIDHAVQERSPSLNNYGIVENNPQLLNMDAISIFDWNFRESFMINGFDYNPTLDQIVLSVRKMSEIVVIDHSTTTEEAAGHEGGNAGKGGDILYRWGNPQNYGQGTADDRYLFFQHNPNWITTGEHEGKIICYNNGLGRSETDINKGYSQVPIIDTPVNSDGTYILSPGEAYAPSEPDKAYGKNDSGTEFYSGYTSGAEMLANGNVYITEGTSGRLFEVNTDGDIVWEYYLINSNYIFRSEKYAPEYLGFTGKDLTPSGNTIEEQGGIPNCNIISSVEETFVSRDKFKISHIDRVNSIQHKEGKTFQLTIYDMLGQRIYHSNTNSDYHTVDLGNVREGIYIMQVDMKENHHHASFKFSSF